MIKNVNVQSMNFYVMNFVYIFAKTICFQALTRTALLYEWVIVKSMLSSNIKLYLSPFLV